MNNLEDTIGLMTSDSHKDRLKAEYWQTRIRYNKLHKKIIKYEAGAYMTDFELIIDLLHKQELYMRNYLRILEIRVEFEKIDLGNDNEN